MFGFLDNQWLKKKKIQHIWGNTCITLDDTKPQIPNRTRSDDHNHDLVFVQEIFFHLLSYNFFVQGYIARDLVKQGLKVGELVIFLANNLMEFFLCVF
jgi:hypothetical protein